MSSVAYPPQTSVPAPPASIDGDGNKAEILSWAKDERRRHRRKAREYWWAWAVLQAVTIIAAAAATVLAAADVTSVDPVSRAIPAAVATLAAAFMAAFHPRTTSQRHLRSWRLLNYEILKFEGNLREYRARPPRPKREGIDLFLQKVETITLKGDEEPAQETETESGDKEKTLTTAGNGATSGSEPSGE